MKTLYKYDFSQLTDKWELYSLTDPSDLKFTGDGCSIQTPNNKENRIIGSGVHTYNGDAIELLFRILKGDVGKLVFGFSGGMESATVELDFCKNIFSFNTSDWTKKQPVFCDKLFLKEGETHSIRLEKKEGSGDLVKMAHVDVYIDKKLTFSEKNLNVLPEIGVLIKTVGANVNLKTFLHFGIPSKIPEYLNIGGWQMLNQDSINKNIGSLFKGLDIAAEKGLQLLITPETSLTGLFPKHSVTNEPGPVCEAEVKVMEYIKKLNNAPYTIIGMPIWKEINEHSIDKTRYNASRVYDPDGNIVATCPKIHSCEDNFWHGMRLHEFEIFGVPVTMHICHDGRYPELWTLPVMFGSRLIIHPANGGEFLAVLMHSRQKQKWLLLILMHFIFM